MAEAKVVINLKEGIIDLQGPVDFVRHYLDMYQPAIKGLQSSAEPVAESQEKAKRLPRKRKVMPAAKGKRARPISCTRAIRNDLEAGFFDEPRSTSDIKRRLTEAGSSFSDGNVRNSLKRLSKSGALGTTGRGGTLRYLRAKQS
jgi:hypothetical protein